MEREVGIGVWSGGGVTRSNSSRIKRGYLKVFEVGELNEEMREDGGEENALEREEEEEKDGKGERGRLKATW